MSRAIDRGARDNWIDVNWVHQLLVTLNDLFAEGEDYLAELAALKDQEKKRKLRSPDAPKGAKKTDPKLRETQPW